MRLSISILASLVLATSLARARAGAPAFTVEPNPASPGQPVVLRWAFSGERIVLAGGRFGKGTVVTGRKTVVDHPRKPTRYTIDVWYRKRAVAGRPARRLHARYQVVVNIGAGPAGGLASYHDPRGWQVRYQAGWQHDDVPLPDPENNRLVYFQQEDDSVERVVVAILPVKDKTADQVMQEVEASLPEHYSKVEILSRSAQQKGDLAERWLIFRGLDQTHDGLPTESLVRLFVLDGRAYVISARTAASRFAERRQALQTMVQSFTPNRRTARSSGSG